jgi:hypothetical protein
MTYVKMSSDFIALEELAEIASLPSRTVEQYVDRLFSVSAQFAHDMSTLSDDSSSRKLDILFKIDELGLSQDFRRDFFEIYEESPVDLDNYFVSLESLFSKHQLTSHVAIELLSDVTR